jgi:hypothetical protein
MKAFGKHSRLSEKGENREEITSHHKVRLIMYLIIPKYLWIRRIHLSL